jgi:hypothetical protein
MLSLGTEWAPSFSNFLIYFFLFTENRKQKTENRLHSSPKYA